MASATRLRRPGKADINKEQKESDETMTNKTEYERKTNIEASVYSKILNNINKKKKKKINHDNNKWRETNQKKRVSFQ